MNLNLFLFPFFNRTAELVILLSSPLFLFSQGTWTAKSSVFPTPRAGVIGFSIGLKGYFGTGWQYSNGLYFDDFWEWDSGTNIWTQKAVFPGSARGDAVGFSIGNKGYIATGTDINNSKNNDLWEYDQATNSWSAKANFPGSQRAFSVGFAIGQNGYLGTGWSSSGTEQDFWEWNQTTDTWSQKTNFSGGSRAIAVGFSICNKGYIGTGAYGSSYMNDFWEYDPAGNIWSQKANLPGVPRGYASGFSIDAYGFLGTGYDDNGNALADMWQWDQSSNIWSAINDYPHPVTDIDHASFSIGCKGYFGTGADNPGTPSIYYNDFWEFAPPFNCLPDTSFSLSTNTTDVTCTGNNGSATVTVTGGSPPFSYLWLPGGQTGSTATGLAPGTYFIRVNENGSATCSMSGFNVDTAVVSAASGFTGQSHNSTDVTCSNDGTVAISVSGGTAPYTYTWSPASGGQTGSTVTGLSTGTYHVTVQDASGCQTIDSMTVTSAPNSLTVSYYKQNIACDSLWTGGGYILLTVTNGDQPYTYLWSTGGTTGELWNILTPGTYYVTVSDANGCQVISGIQINQPASFWYISSIEVSGACIGNNGKLIIRLGNGSFYNISSFIYDSLFTIWIPGDTLYTGLSPGNYICHINDDKSCKDTSFAFTITNAALALNSLQTDPFCSGSGDGMIWVSSLSGTPPFTYNWSGGGSDSLLTGLDSGTYTISVTDSGGCSTVKTFILSEPAPVSVSFSVTNTPCGLGEGTVSVSATGGTGSYSWSWSTGDTLQTIANLVSGIYIITVTDDNNCSISDTALVTGIGTSMINLDIIINETCFGGNNGAVIISMNGGTFPFTYTWSNGATGEDIYGIESGIYAVTVTEGSGCVAIDTFTVVEPDSIEILSGAIDATCNGSDGSAWVIVSGGTPGYAYLWNTNSTNDTITSMNSGEYFITVSDFNNCTNVASVTIVISGKPAVNIENITNVSCNGGSDGSASLTVNGGTLPYAYLWSNGATQSLINNLQSATYSATVTDSLGCTVYADTVITEPPKIVVSISTAPAGCTGGGTAAVAVSGGAGTYSYMWNNGNTLSTIYNLQSTSYTVTVTDGNGCRLSDTATVALNETIVATIDGTGEICPGQQNQLTASGGGTYSWNTGATTATLTVAPDVTTLYSVVAGLGSCSDSALFNVIVFPAVGVSVRDTVIYSGDMALLSAILIGGTSPYTYTWIPGNQNTPDITVSPLSASNYLVLVVDANGCTSYDSVFVNVIPCDAEVFIPNAFAPDCKCPDNTLKVYSDCIETMELFIYDRWGEKVFETKDQSKGWDGTYKGKPMNAAVYVYYIRYTSINAPGEEKALEGNINLLR